MIKLRHLPLLSLLTVGACLTFAPIAGAQRQATTPPTPGGDGQATLLGQYGDWGAYTGVSGGKKVCFALGKPASSQTNPPNRPRDPAYLFVSTRPADNIRNEVSVIIGYSFKANSDATAEVDTARFTMYTEKDGAWFANRADESRMVDAMRKGAALVVKGTSGRGTETTDRYSLKGIVQAIDRVNQECR